MTALETPTGRIIKFTPERIDQIKNLVERGLNREQIAETIGTTLGSLSVTCSRHGISLRRPKALDLMGREPKHVVMTVSNGDVKITITMKYRGAEKTVEVPLPKDTLANLIIMADIKGKSVGEEIASILKRVMVGADGQ